MGRGRTHLPTGGFDMSPMTAVAKTIFKGDTFFNETATLITGEMTPKIQNLINNGSFENDGNMWNIDAPSAVSSNHAKNGSKCLNLFTDDGNYRPFTQPVKIVAGHIYYACGWYMRTLSITGSADVDCIGGATEMDFYSILNALSTANTWYFLSGIATGVTGANSFRHYTFNANPIWCDCLMLIDLTDAFGASNELTKAQMDALVQSLIWWDSPLANVTASGNLSADKMVVGATGYWNATQYSGDLLDYRTEADTPAATGWSYGENYYMGPGRGVYDNTLGSKIYQLKSTVLANMDGLKKSTVTSTNAGYTSDGTLTGTIGTGLSVIKYATIKVWMNGYNGVDAGQRTITITADGAGYYGVDNDGGGGVGHNGTITISGGNINFSDVKQTVVLSHTYNPYITADKPLIIEAYGY